MPKLIKPLSSTQVDKIKPQDKDYKLSDGDGLYLLVKKIGSKLWRMDYSFDKKRKTISFGKYPDISLKQAREKRAEVRSLLAQEQDPMQERKEAKVKQQGNTFQDLALEYFELREDVTAAHRQKQLRQLEKDVFPYVNKQDIAEITTENFLTIIKRIESRGAVETAVRTLSICERVYRYAVTLNRTPYNIVAGIDKNIALKKVKENNYPHIINPSKLAILLNQIEEYHGDISTKSALQVLPYVFVRPYNIRFAEWSEIDFENKRWIIPASKMKSSKEHLVPLTSKVIKIFKSIYPYSGDKQYIFPSPVDINKPVSENTLANALKRLGYKDVMVPHGFRHTASTILHENMHIHKVSSDAIEMQLAHTTGGVKGVYNKALYIEERTKLMQWYSDYLEGLGRK